MDELDVLWQPLTIRGLTIPNRIMVSAHVPSLGTEQYASYLAERARGGAGLLVTGAASVHPTTYGGFTWKAWEQSSVGAMRTAVEAVHAHDRPLIVQIWHVGVHDTGTRTLAEWGPLLAPSAVPSPATGVTPQVMGKAEIEEVVEGFVLSARHVREAGADGVEIHGAHGYLLGEFLSPFSNRRTDEYGGSSANRARLIVEIGEAVRKEVGPDYVMGMKLNFDEFIGELGITPTEAEQTTRILHASGLFDYFSISSSNYHSLHHLMPPESSGLTMHTAAHGTIARRAVNGEVPVMVTGTIRTVEQAAEIVRSGQADIAGMVRAHIAEPEIVLKAQSGRKTEIRRCVGANQGCWRRLGIEISCTVNPTTGREAEWGTAATTRVESPKKVLVIGGGPAGMKLAETAATRGHRVTLVEREPELGGQVRYAAMLPHRAAWGHLVEDLAGSLGRLGVEIRLNTELAASDATEFGADVTVVATGSVWDTSGRTIGRVDQISVPQAAGSSVIDPITAIASSEACGDRVVIVDDNGDYLPLGLAEKLALAGHAVTLVTAAMAIGSKLGGTLDLPWVYPRVLDAGVAIVTSSYVDRIEPRAIVLSDVWGRGTRELPADTVVLSMLRSSDDALFQALSADGLDVRRVGDCVAPREVDDAMLEGVREGFAL